ncbi:hypothetical protein [Nonlabens sp. MB-3u-79]|uniref:hypothetical protein n=1 Tax=Nonlabens sp. MB-3u-79 TaxID=2058134 RepID=UPI0018E1F8A5|nr:hypothetical protein [Nonlabens sp. MB-3u-79]
MKLKLFFILVFCCSIGGAQEYSNLKKKRLAVRDSISLDSISISPAYFKVVDKTGKTIDSSRYNINFSSSILTFKNKTEISADSIDVTYLPLPDFLTKTYQFYDPSIILDNDSRQEQLVALQQPTAVNTFIPFDGLQTSGSITRGVRVGNNQNSVVDSELDLRITGKLSDKVSLRASIQDANVPQTQNGYSQRLDEFDQIFIELYSEDWNIRAGDVDLIQENYQFNNFSKRVQGISGQVRFNGDDSSGYAGASGALVRGTFNISRFTGQEGNQGPYKLTGQNEELFILVVSGSERVFVNGVPLKRGENQDYVIDYNAGEVRFTPTFPITSEMRISIEYQYSERNFTRFIGYGTGGFKSDKFQIDSYVYTETDAKNQPLQQNLSEDQVAILATAGDDRDLAIAPSAIPDEFSENQILYRREVLNGEERFVFSQDRTQQLFNVRFSFLGENQGDYRLINDQAIANIYEYIAPINGVSQGSYDPIIQLFTPEILTIAGIKASYEAATGTKLFTELAASNKDLNKFSSIDDDDNKGVAAKLALIQQLLKKDSLQSLNVTLNTDYIQENFRNVERVYNIEFNRDWNIETTQGSQLFTTLGLNYQLDSTITASYRLEHLEFDNFYNGNRHEIAATYQDSLWQARFRGSVLSTKSTEQESEFNRVNADVLRKINNYYVGTRLESENNQQRLTATDELTGLSQKFTGYEIYAGRGDTTTTFVEIGYRNRTNDSLRDGILSRVNSSNNYYIKSQPIKNKVSSLRIYANYRKLKSAQEGFSDEVSFNSRLQYKRKIYDGKILWNTTYETNSARIPRQDFTYVAVNPGQGTFTWIDYNDDGIQDLNEFEVAQFQDQGSFVRVLLPNQVFLPTHQNKFSQTLTLNPISWTDEKGYKKVLSRFYNQTSYLIDRMVAREGENFDLNPFQSSDNQLGLNLSFRNSLFFNRGKQYFTTNYTYLSTANENLQSIGSISNEIESHQFRFLHKIEDTWLVTINAQSGINASSSENFANRNYEINDLLFKPQLSYLFDNSNRLEVFYQYQSKDNQINDTATLGQQNIGLGWAFNKAQNFAVNGEIKYVKNDFEGQAFSPVGFQMLEGLQPGTNFTWNLLFQKNITKFLDLNLSYSGRGSETARTVHNGSVQLKAYF